MMIRPKVKNEHVQDLEPSQTTATTQAPVNLELKSMTAIAGELGFDVQVSLIQKGGRTSLGAMLHGGK
jgi:hypothetical protein